jgi:hypothetical protein
VHQKTVMMWSNKRYSPSSSSLSSTSSTSEQPLSSAQEQKFLLKELIRLRQQQQDLLMEQERLSESILSNSDNSSVYTSPQEEVENEQSIRAVNYYMEQTKDAMDQRVKWIASKRSQFINKITAMERELQELKKTRLEMEELQSSFEKDTTLTRGVDHSPSVSSSTHSHPPQQLNDDNETYRSHDSSRLNSIEQDTESVTELKDELRVTEAALQILRQGAHDPNSIDRLYLEQIVKLFKEKHASGNNSVEDESDYQSISNSSHRATESTTVNQSVATEDYQSDIVSDYENSSVATEDATDINRNAVIGEFRQLLDSNMNNLDFLFILLREIRLIDTNSARVECLDFFEKLRTNSQEQFESLQSPKKEKYSKYRVSSDNNYVEQQKKQQQIPEDIAYSETSSITKTSEQDESDSESDIDEEPIVKLSNEEIIQHLQSLITQYVNRLVDSVEDAQARFTPDELSRLSMYLYDISKHFFNDKTADKLQQRKSNSELLDGIYETVKLYSGMPRDDTKGDLIKDIMDTLTDELIYRQTIHSIDHSYQQDIEELTDRLADLLRKRKEDMEMLQNRRRISVKGDHYPNPSLQTANIAFEEEDSSTSDSDSQSDEDEEVESNTVLEIEYTNTTDNGLYEQDTEDADSDSKFTIDEKDDFEDYEAITLEDLIGKLPTTEPTEQIEDDEFADDFEDYSSQDLNNSNESLLRQLYNGDRSRSNSIEKSSEDRELEALLKEETRRDEAEDRERSARKDKPRNDNPTMGWIKDEDVFLVENEDLRKYLSIDFLPSELHTLQNRVVQQENIQQHQKAHSPKSGHSPKINPSSPSSADSHSLAITQNNGSEFLQALRVDPQRILNMMEQETRDLERKFQEVEESRARLYRIEESLSPEQHRQLAQSVNNFEMNAKLITQLSQSLDTILGKYRNQ